MIDIQVHIHDRYSIEFKIGYVVRPKEKINDFMMNTWIFIPNNLDVNSFTYSKNQFYRDVKSNIRLITPIYGLDELATEEALPFMFLSVAFNELVADPSKENTSEYEYQIKMFTAIVKSALRKETLRINNSPAGKDRAGLIEAYIRNIHKITGHYRRLREIIRIPAMGKEVLNYFLFGDEFLSNLIEQHTYHLLEGLKHRDPDFFATQEERLLEIIKSEIAYKKSQNYLTVDKESPNHNRDLVFRRRLLKKYAESHLFLNARKKKEGFVQEQVYYSLAAGISMIFATTIAFSFQQKYGNFTMPLFVALVVSYMLKDRIKDLIRYYFAHRLGKNYFDNKTSISIKENPIGWIKEGVDFISEERVPDEVRNMRDRSDLLEADNRNTEEKIILYRKLVSIDALALDENNQYDIVGINDILRYNISNFIQKMDNPEVPLYLPSEKNGYEIINGEKIYYVNFLIQFQFDGDINYKRFRLILSRNGIQGIEKIKG